MQRSFFVNILLLVLINLLIKPAFIFGVDLGVQNHSATGAYGTYFALLNWTYLFQILNDFGLQNFNSGLVSRHPKLVRKYLPKLLVIKGLFSILYLILAWLAAWLIAGYDVFSLQLLAILLLNQVLTQGIIFLRTNISGLGFYRLDSLLSALDKLLMLIGCGFALWLHDPASGFFPIERFAWVQTLALLLSFGIVWSILTRKIGGSPTPSLRGWWRSPLLRLLIRQSAPYAMVILLMSAYTRLDGVLLERLLPDGPAHADIYAGAYRLLDACNMFGYLFATLLLPMFGRLLGSKHDVRPLTGFSFKLIWAGSVTLSSAVYMFRYPLILLMFPEKAQLEYRAETLGWLIWVFVPVCTTYIYSTLLTADRRLTAMNRFFVIGLALDVVLNLTLIPSMQALGAARATLITQIFVALAMIWLCYRFYGFQMRRIEVLQLAGFAASVVVVQRLISWIENVHWLGCFLLALFAGGILGFAFQVIDLKKGLEAVEEY